jgi:hypothetical protein
MVTRIARWGLKTLALAMKRLGSTRILIEISAGKRQAGRKQESEDKFGSGELRDCDLDVT